MKTTELEAAGVTIELDAAVGPRVLYPATVLPEDLEPIVPAGWAVDYDTPHVRVGYDSVRDCPRYSAPLRSDP
jgi:hypothetical protein